MMIILSQYIAPAKTLAKNILNIIYIHIIQYIYTEYNLHKC